MDSVFEILIKLWGNVNELLPRANPDYWVKNIYECLEIPWMKILAESGVHPIDEFYDLRITKECRRLRVVGRYMINEIYFQGLNI